MSDPVARLNAALEGRYAIERELGEGGMATVYLAADLKHERKVALKVLKPELAAVVGAERFLAEIKTTANLQHPNILPLFDSGEVDGFLFYVMPYVEGETLREKLERQRQLPLEEAVRIASGVAEALDHAHRQGVVHRDIKPANILIRDTRPLVADFGIALAAGEGDRTRLTQTGMSIGTAAYMSPEQSMEGDQVDGRSDTYSLGCVLYEMLLGDPPFTGSNPLAILVRKSTETPSGLRTVRETIPQALEEAVLRALAVTPADRFTTAADFAEAIRDESLALAVPSSGSRAKTQHVSPASMRTGRFAVSLMLGLIAVAVLLVGRSMFGTSDEDVRPSTGAGVETPVIVVLPFENQGAPEDDYFTAGMTDEIRRLVGVSGLRVISRRAALGYAGTDKSVPQIGEELGVGHILEGTVDWADAGAGSRVRISVELIRVADAELVWSNSFDRVIENVFDLQSDIARQVIDQLGVTLLGSEHPELAASATENAEAYKLYIKGRFFWDKRTDQDVQTALAYFQQAVGLDPGYSLAHVGIALVWIYRGWYSIVAPSEAATHLKEAVQNALQFDEGLAEAHASLAEVYYEFDHDWEAAEREYELAIALDPNYATGHQWYSGYLSAMGRHEEALREAERARELDPLSPIISTFVGLAHYFAGRYEQAIQEYGIALELDPRFEPAHWHLGWALEQTGQYVEAISAAQQAIDNSEGNPLYIASLGHAYAKAGDITQARQVLDRLEREAATRHVSAYHTGVIYGAIGEIDEAFVWLDRAFEERSSWIGYMAVDPRLDGLRSDPRFDALIRKAGLRTRPPRS